MGYGLDFNNDGKVDSTEEFISFQMSRQAYKNIKNGNGACLTATLTLILVPVFLLWQLSRRYSACLVQF
jgi:hypothetical protein